MSPAYKLCTEAVTSCICLRSNEAHLQSLLGRCPPPPPPTTSILHSILQYLNMMQATGEALTNYQKIDRDHPRSKQSLFLLLYLYCILMQCKPKEKEKRKINSFLLCFLTNGATDIRRDPIKTKKAKARKKRKKKRKDKAQK